MYSSLISSELRRCNTACLILAKADPVRFKELVNGKLGGHVWWQAWDMAEGSSSDSPEQPADRTCIEVLVLIVRTHAWNKSQHV